MLALLTLSQAWLMNAPACPRTPVVPPRCRTSIAVATQGRPTRVRNDAARGMVQRLSALRTSAAGVDLAGMDRLLRATDGLAGKMLLDVLIGLKEQGRWQMCHAVARWLEASQAKPKLGRGAKRPPRPAKSGAAPADDEIGMDMGELLASVGDGAPAVPVKDGPPVDTIHYNVLISACAAPRRWREALDLGSRMRERRVPLDTVTYNALIKVMHNSGRWKLALKMLRQMRREKVPPDTVTFSTAIAACGKAGEQRRALLLLPMMAASNVVPNTITFSSCISACERQGEWKQALELLDAMAELGTAPDLICLNAAIGACARGGAPDEARRLLRDVVPSLGLAPDATSFNGYITALANAEPPRWEGALDALGEMAAEGVAPNLYSANAALSALGKAGQWQRAVEFLEAMPSQHGGGTTPDAVSYTSAISGCERAAEWMAAAQLLRQMQQAGVAPTTLTYSKVLCAHAAAGEWRTTTQLIEAITADRLLHNAFTINRMLRCCLDAAEGGQAGATEAALAAVLPPLRAATAKVAGPLVFDAESLELLTSLLRARQAAGGAAAAAPAPAASGEEVSAAEWQAAAEAEEAAADAAAEAVAQASRLLPKLYPLVEARQELAVRRAQSDEQLAKDWEAAFPGGVQAKGLARLWLPGLA